MQEAHQRGNGVIRGYDGCRVDMWRSGDWCVRAGRCSIVMKLVDVLIRTLVLLILIIVL